MCGLLLGPQRLYQNFLLLNGIHAQTVLEKKASSAIGACQLPMRDRETDRRTVEAEDLPAERLPRLVHEVPSCGQYARVADAVRARGLEQLPGTSVVVEVARLAPRQHRLGLRRRARQPPVHLAAAGVPALVHHLGGAVGRQGKRSSGLVPPQGWLSVVGNATSSEGRASMPTFFLRRVVIHPCATPPAPPAVHSRPRRPAGPAAAPLPPLCSPATNPPTHQTITSIGRRRHHRQ
jgi:hypothetical protein